MDGKVSLITGGERSSLTGSTAVQRFNPGQCRKNPGRFHLDLAWHPGAVSRCPVYLGGNSYRSGVWESSAWPMTSLWPDGLVVFWGEEEVSHEYGTAYRRDT